VVIVVITVNVSNMEKEDMVGQVGHDGEVVYVGQNR